KIFANLNNKNNMIRIKNQYSSGHKRRLVSQLVHSQLGNETAESFYGASKQQYGAGNRILCDEASHDLQTGNEICENGISEGTDCESVVVSSDCESISSEESNTVEEDCLEDFLRSWSFSSEGFQNSAEDSETDNNKIS
ncbi:unnamed protein product, partial [Allacma fusca]